MAVGKSFDFEFSLWHCWWRLKQLNLSKEGNSRLESVSLVFNCFASEMFLVFYSSSVSIILWTVHTSTTCGVLSYLLCKSWPLSILFPAGPRRKRFRSITLWLNSIRISWRMHRKKATWKWLSLDFASRQFYAFQSAKKSQIFIG